VADPAPKLPYERRLLLLAVAAAAPALVLAGALLAVSPWPLAWRAGLLAVALLATFATAAQLRRRMVWPLRTVASLLGALRDGDFSTRLRGEIRGDALGELTYEANALAGLLQQERLKAQEASGLRDAVMAEIEVAILVFGPGEKLILVNRAGESLLGRPGAELLGAGADELGLADCLEGERSRTLDRDFPGASGRFALRRTLVRSGGQPLPLLAIANLSSALREEERTAWQRLIRVLGHELNNSLTPIKSIAGSLVRAVGQEEPSAEARAELEQGLRLIEARAASLARFLEGYSRLARLPPPRLQEVAIGPLAAELAAGEARVPVVVEPGPEVAVEADPDQLRQLLQNLLANAAEATLERPAAGPVRIAWRVEGGEVLLEVRDEGPGIANPANLFVPFFTTKKGGSGIGLALCRQIAEAHGGGLVLGPGTDAGCVAELRLPAAPLAEPG